MAHETSRMAKEESFVWWLLLVLGVRSVKVVWSLGTRSCTCSARSGSYHAVSRGARGQATGPTAIVPEGAGHGTQDMPACHTSRLMGPWALSCSWGLARAKHFPCTSMHPGGWLELHGQPTTKAPRLGGHRHPDRCEEWESPLHLSASDTRSKCVWHTSLRSWHK